MLVALASLAVATPALHAQAGSYQVRRGDTLWSIAKRTGATLARLIADNHLADPSLIIPGQTLELPGSSPLCTDRYRVQPGDTIWGVARRLHLTPARVLELNHLGDPNLIRPGQQIVVADCALSKPSSPSAPTLSQRDAIAMLEAAAHDQGLNPNFVLAVSYWESGWNQAAVSKDGAIGLMQVMPSTAAWAGPGLLGHPVDIHDPRQNAETGAALLRRYLYDFGDPKLALAAYYQGALAVRKDGIFPSSRSYVNGIWHLRNRFQVGGLPLPGAA